MKTRLFPALGLFFCLLSLFVACKSDIANVTLTFECDGGTTIDPITIVSGQKVSLPVTTKSDQVFQGWFTDEQLTKEFTGDTPITNTTLTLTLYAKWASSPYTYEFSVDSNNVPISATISGKTSGAIVNMEIPSAYWTLPVKAIKDLAFNETDILSGNLVIPDSVETIGLKAFEYIDGLDGELTIGSHVKTIGVHAFYYCSGFKNQLNIPESVETIGDYAFYVCKKFTGSLTIPSKMETIEKGTFGYCSGFDGDLTIGSSVKTIGEDAFIECTGFKGTLTLPASLTTIGKTAFFNCSSFVSTIEYKSTTADWAKISLDSSWKNGASFTAVHCTDGTVTL